MIDRVPGKTVGEVEAEIANAVARFHREQHGRGPSDARAFVLCDMVIVRCTGILTATETKLTGTEEGRRLVRSARHELRSISEAEIEAAIASATGCRVLRSYSDVDVGAAELVEVFIVDRDLEETLTPKRDRRADGADGTGRDPRQERRP